MVLTADNDLTTNVDKLFIKYISVGSHRLQYRSEQNREWENSNEVLKEILYIFSYIQVKYDKMFLFSVCLLVGLN